MLVMMNVVVDFKNHHRYSDVEYLDTVQTEMKNFLMERVCSFFCGFYRSGERNLEKATLNPLGEIGTPMCLGSPRVSTPNRTLICSAIFAWGRHVSD